MKRGEPEATHNEEEDLPTFGEMINMDILYGLGLPYLFDVGTQEGAGE